MELPYLVFLSVLGPIIAHEIISSAERTAKVHLWQQIDDMILSPIQTQFLFTPFFNDGRNAQRAVLYRWRNATVPYEVDSAFSDSQRQLIAKVLEEKYVKTCVKFRPRTKTDKDYIRVINQSGCWSYVGRKGYEQKLSLQKNGCLHPEIIAHEFLHALGLFHQQSAANRDDYITIQWENIIPGVENNFDKYEKSTDFGQPYDYGSVMHYPQNAFSFNGKPTMIAKRRNVKFGYAKSLSPIDIIKVNKMYNCEEK